MYMLETLSLLPVGAQRPGIAPINGYLLFSVHDIVCESPWCIACEIPPFNPLSLGLCDSHRLTS